MLQTSRVTGHEWQLCCCVVQLDGAPVQYYMRKSSTEAASLCRVILRATRDFLSACPRLVNETNQQKITLVTISEEAAG